MYFESIKNGYNHQYLYLGSVGLLVCVCVWCSFVLQILSVVCWRSCIWTRFSLCLSKTYIVYLSYCRGFIYLYAVQVATRFSAVFSDSTIWKQCKYIYKIKNELIQKYKKVSCWKETDTRVLPHLVFWFTVTLQCCWSVFFSWNFFPVFFQQFYLHILYILFPFFPISSDFCSAHAGLLFTYFFGRKHYYFNKRSIQQLKKKKTEEKT